MAHLVAEVCKICDTRKINTSPYHPETNGLCERFNGSLADMLSMFCNSHQTDWDRCLSFVLFAYRTAAQATTGETPAYLLYGRDL